MAVSTTTSSVTYTGVGGVTVFPVPFAFVSHSHVVVELRTLPAGPLTTLTEGPDYSLSGERNPTGGTLSLTVALAVGAQLTVRRVVPLTQSVQLPTYGPLASRTIEDALDVAAMRSQAEAESRVLVEGSVSALAAADTALQGRATALESADVTLGTRATTLEGRATALESGATTLGNRATSLEGRATALESADTALSGRVTTLEAAGGGGSSQWADGAAGAISYSAGSVGVGTAAPDASAALHVAATGADVPMWVDRYNNGAGQRPSGVVVRTARGGPGAPSAVQAGDMIGGYAVRGRGLTAWAPDAGAGIGFRATQDWTDAAQGVAAFIGTTPNGGTAYTEALTVNHNGNVGIGTAAPTAKLDVAGDMKAGGLYATAITTDGFLSEGSIEAYGDIFTDGEVRGAALVAAGLATAGSLAVDTDVLVVDATNNRVGVGTAAPTAKLDVVGDVKVSGNISATNATFTGALTVDTSLIKVDPTNNLVGINNPSPSYNLDVVGIINASGGINSTGGFLLTGGGGRFHCVNEDTKTTKFAMRSFNDSDQCGMGQLHQENFLCNISAAFTNRRIGFYLDLPDNGTAGVLTTSADMYVKTTGVEVKRALTVGGDIQAGTIAANKSTVKLVQDAASASQAKVQFYRGTSQTGSIGYNAVGTNMEVITDGLLALKTTTAASVTAVIAGTTKMTVQSSKTTFDHAVEVNGNLDVDNATLFVNAATNRVGVMNASPGEALDVIGNIKVQTTGNGLLLPISTVKQLSPFAAAHGRLHLAGAGSYAHDAGPAVPVKFDAASYTAVNLTATTGVGARFTVPAGAAGLAGVYVVSGNLTLSDGDSGTSYFLVELWKNGVKYARIGMGRGTNIDVPEDVPFHGLVSLSPGDYVDVHVIAQGTNPGVWGLGNDYTAAGFQLGDSYVEVARLCPLA